MIGPENTDGKQESGSDKRSLATTIRLGSENSKQINEVLEMLPEEEQYAEQLVKHIYAEALNSRKIGKPIRNEAAVEKMIAGKIFEDYVKKEQALGLFREKKDDTEMLPLDQEKEEQKKMRQSFEEKISEILQDPEKAGFLDWDKINRVPDLSFVETRFTTSGELILVITGVGEAKAGHLDERTFQQITHFRQTLLTIINSLNKLTPEQAKFMHLEGFGVQGAPIRLVKNFRETIIVPHEVKTDHENIPQLVHRSTFGEDEYSFNKFVNILRGNFEEYNVQFKNSSLGKGELAKITSHLSSKIWERMSNDERGPLGQVIIDRKRRIKH